MCVFTFQTTQNPAERRKCHCYYLGLFGGGGGFLDFVNCPLKPEFYSSTRGKKKKKKVVNLVATQESDPLN